MSKMPDHAFLGPSGAIIGEIVDYAGMFPPSRLPLDQALANYIDHRNGEFSWMLSRFVCPYSSLSELQSLLAKYPEQPVVRVSLISPVPVNDTSAFGELLVEIDSINTSSGLVLVDAIEARWNGDLGHHEKWRMTLEVIAALVSSKIEDLNSLFIETPSNDDFDLVKFALALADATADSDKQIGLKIRTGGIEASAFPTVRAVARFLIACSNAGLPFKATAGLHHPLRHYNDSVSTEMHGFMNVFFGAAAFHLMDIDENTLIEILSETDASNFTFTSDYVRWKNLTMSASELAIARTLFATSFGSCSFDEPVEDLQTLQLLPNIYA